MLQSVAIPSGTGKSHFVEALGQQATDQGMTVAWFAIEDLGALVRRHRADDTVAKAIKGRRRRIGGGHGVVAIRHLGPRGRRGYPAGAVDRSRAAYSGARPRRAGRAGAGRPG